MTISGLSSVRATWMGKTKFFPSQHATPNQKKGGVNQYQTLKEHLQTLKNQLSYPLEVYPVSASQTLKKPCLIPEHDHPSSGFEMSINQSVNPVFPRVTSLS